MAADSPTLFLQRAYIEDDRKLRVRYLKVSCLLVAVLTLSGLGLDSYAQHDMFKFIWIRSACIVLALFLFTLCFAKDIERYIRPVGLAWALMTQTSICAMIYYSGDAGSEYYAGLNLIILGISIFLPWTFFETLAICIATLAMYVGTVALIHWFKKSVSLSQDARIFSNFSFLSFTSTICATSSYFTSRGRFETFRLRHELDVRNQELVELDRMKNDFYSNINHELRTPLTLIISPLDEMLRNAELAPAAREALLTVQQSSLRLLKLINDLLELARLEYARACIVKEPVNLSTFLPGLVDTVRHLAMNKGLAVDIRSEKAGLVISADPGRLEKIVLNVLMNAIKFTPSGGRITTCSKQDGNDALIEVEDTGIGIAEKDLPVIFERFRQVDSSSTRRFQGVGIGLALARELVIEHGGSMDVRSALGKGSTFSIRLPLSNGTSHGVSSTGLAVGELEGPGKEELIADMFRRANRVLPPDAPPAQTAVIGKGDKTVLVVDDEQAVRKYISEFLAQDFCVVQAANGKAGLEAARKHHPDLAVLDLMMPEIDGLTLCKMLKSDPETANIRVVLLTARADEGTRLQALERGVDDYLLKPFSAQELRKRVANLIRSGRLEREVREKNTELERTLKQLRETEAQLIQSEKMNALGDLAAGLLHEINNPLNYTMMALQVARDQIPNGNADVDDAMKTIEEGMVRIRDIIAELRTFATPKAAEAMEEFDLLSVSDVALRLVSHELSGIKIERELNERVRASRTMVTQVLVNLILNSAKALHPMAGREKCIRISALRKGARVHVRVWDNGSGIPADILPRIFDPFYTTRDVGEGTGLGLSVCHTIVKKHGGEISARSEPGQWTELTFDLPSAAAVEEN